MKFDENIKSVITAAFYAEHDVFLRLPLPSIKELVFDSAKSVVVLPSAFCGMKSHTYANRKDGFTPNFEELKEDLLFADIGFMADESFRRFLINGNIGRIIVPFAECADNGEYGFRENYMWIDELKAETKGFCQILAFVSPAYENIQNLCDIYAVSDAVILGERKDCDIRVFKTSSVNAKFYQTAFETEKYAFEKVCVIFNTRNEADSFERFLFSRGTKYFRIDGSSTQEEKRKIFDYIDANETGIVIGTKTLINEAVFRQFSECIICGVPFSLSHLTRCSALAKEGRTKVIYCDDDFIRNGKISSSFAALLENEEIKEKRIDNLEKIKLILEQ